MTSTVAAAAAASVEEPSEQPLKYKTWVLKVPIHCQGCKTKVKKVLHSIDGVYTTNIDPKLHKVIVTGNVDVEALIKKLTKTGKPAEMWPENPSGKEKKSGKNKNKGKENDPKSEENCSEDSPPPDTATAARVVSAQKHGGEASDDQGKELKNGGKGTENAPTSENLPAVDHKANESGGGGGGTGKSGGGKKKKKKGQKGNNAEGGGTELSGVPASTGSPAHNSGTDQVMCTVNLSPTRQEPYPCPYPYPPIFFPHPVYVASYSTAYPSISPVPSYYAHSSPYAYAKSNPEIYPIRVTPLDSFEIFSDENPNSCCIV